MAEIIDSYKNSNGTWVVQVSITEDESAFFWFVQKPTLQEARDLVVDFIKMRKDHKDKTDASEDDRLTLRQQINNYDKSWTNAQTRTLLEAIINRINNQDNL